MDLKEIDNLRVAIARFLQKEICGSSNDDIVYEPTPEQCRVFFKKMGGWQTGGNTKVHDYSAVTARKALTAILNCQPCWSEGIGNGNNAKFERALVKYLNGENIPGIGPIPTKIFRKGYSGESSNFATDEMIAEGNDSEYIVSRLFDLCGEIPIGTDMLGSKRVSGIFVVAVVKVAPPVKGRLSIGSITFSDFFEPTLLFDADSMKDFGDCEVRSVRRINPTRKPYMSDDDFAQYIYSIYKPSTHLSEEDLLEEENSIERLKVLFLQKCIRTLAKITLKYLEPMQKLMDDSVGTGSLPRVILDVQHGVLLARQCDQGRFWVLCLSPIEGMKDNSDEQFGREIVDSYEQAIKRVRQRRN